MLINFAHHWTKILLNLEKKSKGLNRRPRYNYFHSTTFNTFFKEALLTQFVRRNRRTDKCFFSPGGFSSHPVKVICHAFHGHSSRVATDLEKSGNLKETSESQGICLKVREFATEFQKSGKSQGILFSEIHFQSRWRS